MPYQSPTENLGRVNIGGRWTDFGTFVTNDQHAMIGHCWDYLIQILMGLGGVREPTAAGKRAPIIDMRLKSTNPMAFLQRDVVGSSAGPLPDTFSSALPFQRIVSRTGVEKWILAYDTC
jgi:hypothetical protein